MKLLNKTLLALLFAPILLTGCDSLLEVDSERYVFPDEYNLGGTNDSIYSLIGLCTQLEKLTDSYVILGELRGDLVDVTRNSNHFLREINSFNISKENPYANNLEAYYSIINNCNYIIQNVDTSTIRYNEKVMYKLYAAAKSIRAWTYLQMVLNYGTVSYIEKPILSIQEAQKDYPVYDLNQLAPVLIEDLKPWKNLEFPQVDGVYDHTFSSSFFPIRVVLGDLYLWAGDYENAANEYRDYLFTDYRLNTSGYRNYRSVVNNAFSGVFYYNWYYTFTNGAEAISVIGATNEYSKNVTIDSLAWNYELKVSEKAVKNWATQMYIGSATLDTLGDMRSITTSARFVFGPDKEIVTWYTFPWPGGDNYLLKYLYMNTRSSSLDPNKNPNRRVLVYRNAGVYLRYAEAVNRLGKPHLAMAVLKNGLNQFTLTDRSIIPANEIPSPLPNYMDFTDLRFDDNVGIRYHGCGEVQTDKTRFIIPAGVDTVTYMEDLIINEAALELATEGNRFQDLMRIAMRRGDNDYLASRVAAKHGADSTAIRTKLSVNRNSWYIK